jgi:eukaryotic translation initiation factor 2-alpha kinase 3
MLEKLGKGGMGSVYKEKHQLDNIIYAVKVVEIQVPLTPEDRSVGEFVKSHPAMKEIEALTKLDHPNIVGYKGCWIEAQ